MAIKRIIGFVIMFTLMALAMETPLAFVNIPSVLIVFGLIGGGVIASGRSILNLISINWNKNATSEELYAASEFYRYMKTLAMGSGYVGTLIGAVLMLGNIKDPAAIGPSLAVAILTILYAVILKYFVFEPIVMRLDERAYETYLNEPGNYKSNEMKNQATENVDDEIVLTGQDGQDMAVAK